MDENFNSSWEDKVTAVWTKSFSMPPEALVSEIDALASEPGVEQAKGLFERASARDRVGLEEEAERFYREALALGTLDPYRMARASIQMASTLRILGQLQESEELLVAELDRHMEEGNPRMLHDEARAILALTYLAQNRPTEAAGLALCTLAPHLSRYNRSVLGNSEEFITKTWS